MARRILLLTGACAALFAAFLLGRRAFVTVEVAGGSMLPGLQPGDFLLVRRGVPVRPAGRIAYLRGEDGRPLLKRIVGLPGESLRVGDHVQVNGDLLLEDYVEGEPAARAYRGVNRLAEDEYFVLGDNRAASTDSRDFGPVRRSAIEGVALLRYWPPGRVGRLDRHPRRFAGRAATGPHSAAIPDPGAVLLHDEERFGTTS